MVVLYNMSAAGVRVVEFGTKKTEAVRVIGNLVRGECPQNSGGIEVGVAVPNRKPAISLQTFNDIQIRRVLRRCAGALRELVICEFAFHRAAGISEVATLM